MSRMSGDGFCFRGALSSSLLLLPLLLLLVWSLFRIPGGWVWRLVVQKEKSLPYDPLRAALTHKCARLTMS